MCDLRPGDETVIHYPTSTVVESNGIWRPRRIRVLAVRDLVAEPLSVDEYLRRPLVQRSRYLVRAWDYGRRNVRNFYLGTCREYACDTDLWLARLSEDGATPELLTRGFRATRKERIQLARTVNRFVRDLPPQSLGVIAPDLRVTMTCKATN